jgi:4-hydroxythreonine-4-phosphate dehydrogenase
MFQVRNMRVFFLSRHLSLREACNAVKKDKVKEYIVRCIEALVKLGIENPLLAAAGLNPHNGEHGLFGYEEVDEITPAVDECIAEGYNVTGPVPGDSVFALALKGKYDGVLSMYHDQGHIATKTVDFEKTISLTIGMPFLRTSVDHGTAFDIAGKGIASGVSMTEAIRLAALYAPLYGRE